MQYQESKPSEFLSRYIESYWSLTDIEAAGKNKVEKILPDGSPEMLFHFGDSMRTSNLEFDGVATSAQACNGEIVGQITGYITLEPTGKTDIFSVRFKPGGIYPFLNIPLNELNHRAIPLEFISKNFYNELCGRMIEARSFEERVSIANNHLIKRIDLKNRSDFIVDAAVKEIMQHGGTISISALVENFGISQRQLERKFNKFVGISPKMLNRITRFQSVLTKVETDPAFGLAGLALDCGFYDQAHFINEFKNFSGDNPLKYLSKDTSLSEKFYRKELVSNFSNIY